MKRPSSANAVIRPDVVASVRACGAAPTPEAATRAMATAASAARTASVCASGVSRVLASEQRRLALPDADAQRRQAEAAAAAPELVQQRHDEAGPPPSPGGGGRRRNA